MCTLRAALSADNCSAKQDRAGKNVAVSTAQ